MNARLSYTPGPWYVNDEAGTIVTGQAAGTQTIAAVAPTSDNTSDFFNSRLIAQAPKLHAALQLLASPRYPTAYIAGEIWAVQAHSDAVRALQLVLVLPPDKIRKMT